MLSIAIAALLLVFVVVNGEALSNLELDSKTYIAGDVVTVRFSRADKQGIPTTERCVWYDATGKTIESCSSSSLKPDGLGSFKTSCLLEKERNSFGKHTVECVSTASGKHLLSIKSSSFDVVMNTAGGIGSRSSRILWEPEGPPGDGPWAPPPGVGPGPPPGEGPGEEPGEGPGMGPGSGPEPFDDDQPAPAPVPTDDHTMDDDYAVTWMPTENHNPVPQPGPVPEPGPYVFDDDGGQAPDSDDPGSGPASPVYTDDIAPNPNPAPGPQGPKDADDDDWTPPTEAPTSDISFAVTFAMTLSGVSKASWDKDTSSYNSAWALALVRTISSYYVTQSNIIDISVSAVESSSDDANMDSAKVEVTGTVSANDPSETADEVYSSIEAAVGNGLFTYLLDEEAKLINAWDLEASKAESVKRITASASEEASDQTLDEGKATENQTKEKQEQRDEGAERDSGDSSSSSSSARKSSGELGAGAVAGIVVGSVTVVTLVALSYHLLCRRHSDSKGTSASLEAIGLSPASVTAAVEPEQTANPMQV